MLVGIQHRLERARSEAGISGLHARWSLSAGREETIEDACVDSVSCSGTRGVAANGSATTVRDLLASSAGGTDIGSIEAALGVRGGFDTVTTGGGFETAETLPGLSLSVSPEVTSYGFGGAHGFAALTLSAGSLAAEIDVPGHGIGAPGWADMPLAGGSFSTGMAGTD